MKTVLAATLVTVILSGSACCGSAGGRAGQAAAPVSNPGAANTEAEPPDSNASPKTVPPPPSPAARLTGFEDTAWGMSRAQLVSVYPDFPQISAYLYGLEATVELNMESDALVGIVASFSKFFPSMESCGEELERVRAALGEELGRSQTDNLSSVWRTEHSEVSLECNPGDDELSHARMWLRYQPAGD